MEFKYKIGELNLLSELELPMLREVFFDKPDLHISLKQNIKAPKETIEFYENHILYKDSYANNFVITDTEIHICIKNQEFKREAAITIMGIPLGYLLQKNRFQVLHGSCIAQDNTAISFIGSSRAGKSSIALALIKYGFKLVTEDLCIIKNKSIYNFSNWIKSSKSVIPKELSYSNEILIRRDSRNRSLFELEDTFISNPQSDLKLVYFLAQSNKSNIIKLDALEAFKYLFTYAYRKHDLDKESLKNLSEIYKNTDCFLFSRDLNRSLDENKKIILDHLHQKL